MKPSPVFGQKMILPFLILAFMLIPGQALAQHLPLLSGPDFEAAFAYTGLILGPDNEVNLEINLINKDYSGDSFHVEITGAPEGWDTEINRFSHSISGIFLAGEENTTLNLLASPPGDPDQLPVGDFSFAVRITSEKTKKTLDLKTMVRVLDRKKSRESLVLSTSYPEIGGPSDGRFAFSLDIKNNGPEDSLVNLMAEVPQNWEASFKPGYEDKQISSLTVPKGQSRNVTLDLTPAYMSEAASYPVKVRAESLGASSEVSLTVNLSGTFKIRAIPANELLSSSTEVEKPVTLSLFIINEGSATQKEINFITVKPDNWQVEFKPENIINLEPRSNPVQVDMTVTPAPGALIGDYGLGVSVSGEKTQTPLDFRITVRAGQKWSILGALVIILVVAALALTFRRLGRR